MLIKLCLQKLVVKVAIISHRDKDDLCTSLAPRDQVGVVLENRKDYDRFLSVDNSLLFVLLLIKLVDF